MKARLAEMSIIPNEGYSLSTYTDRLEGRLYMFNTPIADFDYSRVNGLELYNYTPDVRLEQNIDLIIGGLLKLYSWERVWEEATLEDKVSLYVRLLVVLEACATLSKSEGDYSIYVTGRTPFEVDFNPTDSVICVGSKEDTPLEYWGLANLEGSFDWRLNARDFIAFADNN